MIKKPSIDELISMLEKKFGKLIPEAKLCVNDIYENYDDFIKAFTERKNYLVNLEISPNLLAKKLP